MIPHGFQIGYFYDIFLTSRWYPSRIKVRLLSWKSWELSIRLSRLINKRKRKKCIWFYLVLDINLFLFFFSYILLNSIEFKALWLVNASWMMFNSHKLERYFKVMMSGIRVFLNTKPWKYEKNQTDWKAWVRSLI